MSKIRLITGSTLGGAEYVADHLSNVLNEQGRDNEVFNQAELDDLIQAKQLIIVTSTHGAGELPENIQPLFDELSAMTVDLSGLKFGVVGLGSSDYDTFCNAVNIVEKGLKAKGAIQVCESLRIDVVNNFDHDGSAEMWLPHFLSNI